MTLVDTQKAKEFIEVKLNFMIGQLELKEKMDSAEEINIIDVRHAEDYQCGHIPGAASLPQDQWTTFSGLSKNRVNVIYRYSEV